MVSVIIPTYNRANTIKRSILSVLNQTYKDIELIIVDDNSTDNTECIVRSIEDSRLNYIKLKKNNGACNARNIGIEISRGKYIAFQDSDDEWVEDKLEKQLNKIIDDDLDFVFCSFNNNDGNRIEIVPKIDIKGNVYNQLLNFNVIGTPTILAKKECFKDDRFDLNLNRFQDWELAIRICEKYRVGFIKEALVNVYVQDDSMTKDYLRLYPAYKYIFNKHIVNIKNKNIILNFYKYLIETAPTNALKLEYSIQREYIQKDKLNPMII